MVTTNLDSGGRLIAVTGGEKGHETIGEYSTLTAPYSLVFQAVKKVLSICKVITICRITALCASVPKVAELVRHFLGAYQPQP
jgi:hypothetical protein